MKSGATRESIMNAARASIAMMTRATAMILNVFQKRERLVGVPLEADSMAESLTDSLADSLADSEVDSETDLETKSEAASEAE